MTTVHKPYITAFVLFVCSTVACVTELFRHQWGMALIWAVLTIALFVVTGLVARVIELRNDMRSAEARIKSLRLMTITQNSLIAGAGPDTRQDTADLLHRRMVEYGLSMPTVPIQRGDRLTRGLAPGPAEHEVQAGR